VKSRKKHLNRIKIVATTSNLITRNKKEKFDRLGILERHSFHFLPNHQQFQTPTLAYKFLAGIQFRLAQNNNNTTVKAKGGIFPFSSRRPPPLLLAFPPVPRVTAVEELGAHGLQLRKRSGVWRARNPRPLIALSLI
jgi:hypothetical protein